MKRVFYIAYFILVFNFCSCIYCSAQNYNEYFSRFSAQMLCEYANLYLENGDFQSATTFAQQAWDMIKDVNDPLADIQRAMIANTLSNIYNNTGDYKNAEEFAWKAINIAKKVNGGRLPDDNAAVVNGLGQVYYNLGDYANALKYYSLADSMLTEAMKEYKADGKYEYNESIFKQLQATFYGNIGTTYYKLEEWSLAIKYFKKTTETFESLYEKENNYSIAPLYATALANYGMALFYYNRDPQAEKLCKKALEIGSRFLHADHIFIATCWQNLGIIAEGQKDFKMALQNYENALHIAETNIDESHPYYCTLLNLIGKLYCNHGYYNQAKLVLEKSFLSTKKTFIQASNYLIESQRALYLDKIKTEGADFYPVFTYRAFPFDKASAGFAYDNELFIKGLLLYSSNIIKNSIFESKDTTLIRQWNELTAKKQQIMALEEKAPNSDYLTKLREEAETLEKEITRSSAAYRENMRQWGITWDSVRAVLKPNQVTIEFMRAPLNEDSTMYCALLLRHDSEYPELIPLFEEKQVTRLLHNSTGDSAKINKTYLYGRNGDTLTRLIWGNILPRIHKGDEIYISPTHLLHQIAIEHLPYDETHTMNEVYSIVRLSSTRELVLPEKPIPHKKATLYGGIEYRALSDEVMAYNNQLYAKRDLSAPQEESQRQLHGYYAWPLKGTQKEVDAIAPILKSQKIAVTIYSDFSACEESVKGLSGQKQNILHFATHGMYVDTLTTNDPLDRCLLTFAGANRALTGGKLREDVDDGLLSAKEISVLDFREADIVVMSACETGLGDVSGEGVFGLQRAFKMAGAQTILMALWQVDDNATQMLMTAFYRYYSKGISKREAFRKAQQEVRNYTETKTVPHYTDEMSQEERMANQGKIVAPKTVIETITEKPYEAPYFWAGFILLD